MTAGVVLAQIDRRAPGRQSQQQAISGQAGDRGVKFDNDVRNRAGGVLNRPPCGHAGPARQGPDDQRHPAIPGALVGRVVAGGITFQRDQEPHDFLLPDFQAAAYALPGRADDGAPGDLVPVAPGGRPNVHVLMLERHGENQVRAAGHEAGGRGACDGLPAAERHDVRARGDERAQVFRGRHRRCRIDDHWKAEGPHGRRDIGQGLRTARGRRVEQEAGRAASIAPQALAGHGGGLDLKQCRAGRPDSVVIAIAVTAKNEYCAAKTCALRQPLHRVDVEAGQAGSRGQGEPRRRAADHIAVLGPGDLGDHLAGPPRQQFHRDVPRRGVGHRGDHLSVGS